MGLLRQGTALAGDGVGAGAVGVGTAAVGEDAGADGVATATVGTRERSSSTSSYPRSTTTSLPRDSATVRGGYVARRALPPVWGASPAPICSGRTASV